MIESIGVDSRYCEYAILFIRFNGQKDTELNKSNKQTEQITNESNVCLNSIQSMEYRIARNFTKGENFVNSAMFQHFYKNSLSIMESFTMLDGAPGQLFMTFRSIDVPTEKEKQVMVKNENSGHNASEGDNVVLNVHLG